MSESIFFGNKSSDWLIVSSQFINNDSERPNPQLKQAWVQGASAKICKIHQ